jgi:glycine/D-amino acid oxidase-like deaminating enzyme
VPQGTLPTPLANGPEGAAHFSEFAYRKRLDGGYTIASAGTITADIVPDSFKFFGDFLPIMKLDLSSPRLKFGHRFFEEWRQTRNVPLDRPSPCEDVRVLDPKPEVAKSETALAKLKTALRVFSEVKVTQYWAGLIDVTPGAVPVISPVDQAPGFFIATVFSGHGFGVGPAAGRLVADLVTGDPPIVDPTAFRFSRFTDGSRARPDASI